MGHPAFLSSSIMRGRASGFVVFGFAARNAQRLPLRSTQVFGEEDDLSNVLRVVGERAVERLHYRVRLLPNGHGAWRCV